MADFPKPNPPSHVIPQVGAILHLNTALDYPSVLLGNKHWALDGSCVLVAPDRILTIRHTLIKTGRYAAFFPYEGFIPIKEERVEDYRFGDTVSLCRLARPVLYAAPLEYRYISREKLSSALVAGYGRWENLPGWERDGIQRSVEVKLHMPGKEAQDKYGHNFDLCWWSPWNERLVAARNNSGGAVLLPSEDEPTLLGLVREAKGDQQAASRVTEDRKEKWLDEELKGISYQPLGEARRAMEPRVLSITRSRGETVSIEIPDDVGKVDVTLSTTPGLRLQMGIAQGGASRSFLEDLATSDHGSGRFLYRHEILRKDGPRELTIGVVPVAQAPAEADEVRAQLCCMFT